MLKMIYQPLENVKFTFSGFLLLCLNRYAIVYWKTKISRKNQHIGGIHMETTYILNTCDYNFTKYSDGGFSGRILLATPKKADLPKLLIKSDNPSSACNEFMYSRLGELLGIMLPKAYIMNVAPKDAHRFGSPYVVGIEFMDGMHSFTLEEMRASELLRKEYAEQYALSALFYQDDRTQLTMRTDGHITGFDFTETFWLNDMSIYTYQLSDDTLTDILSNRLHMAAERTIFMLRAGASTLNDHFNQPNTALPADAYLVPMRSFLKLTDEQVVELTDALFEVYPVSIVVYFEEYVKTLKQVIDAYLRSVAETAK